MEIFEICPCKSFSTFFIFTKLKCVVFHLEQHSDIKTYLHEFFTSVICTTDIKNVTFYIIYMYNNVKGHHRRFRFIQTYVQAKK